MQRIDDFEFLRMLRDRLSARRRCAEAAPFAYHREREIVRGHLFICAAVRRVEKGRKQQ